MQDFQLDIVTPYGEIFSGKVASVYLPGKDGEFGVLPGHSDMLALLQAGVIDIRSSSGNNLVAINWGYVSVDSHKVNVLADGAVCIKGSDTSVAKALAEAKKLLEEASSDTSMVAGALRKLDNVK